MPSHTFPNSKSCHQCKHRQPCLVMCSNVSRGLQHNLQCKKLYCLRCVDRYYEGRILENKLEKLYWNCPGCEGICSCSACRRQQETPKNRQKFTTSLFHLWFENFSQRQQQEVFYPAPVYAVPIFHDFGPPANGTPFMGIRPYVKMC